MVHKIHFKDRSIEEIVRSAYEVFPRETIGNLYGNKISNNTYIHSVHPYQKADRKYTEVEPNTKSDNRLNSKDKVGDVHSHLEYWHTHEKKFEKGVAALSGLDKDFFDEDPNLISIVIAMNRTKRRTPVVVNQKKKIISGTYKNGNQDDVTKYHVAIRGYYKNNGKIKRAILKAKKRILKKVFYTHQDHN